MALAHQFVNLHRRWAEFFGDQGTAARHFVVGGWRRRRGGSDVAPLVHRPRLHRAQNLENIGRRFGQYGALAEKVVGAAAARIEGRAGDREHLAALIERAPRRDQGA